MDNAVPHTFVKDPEPAPQEEIPVPGLLEDLLLATWSRYRMEGNGLFSARGFARQLELQGFGGRVVPGETLGLADSVIAVATETVGKSFYLLPSFTRSKLATADWFDGPGTVRTALVKRLLHLAIVESSGQGWKCTRRGAVE